MEFAAIVHRGIRVGILLGSGMVFVTGVATAQCVDRGSYSDGAVSNAKAKPYEAKQVTTIVTDLGDGTKRVVVTKTNLFRDSNGRIRQERFYDGTDDPSENAPSDIWINDNCGTNVSLLPSTQTATITKSVAPVKGSDQPFVGRLISRTFPMLGQPEGLKTSGTSSSMASRSVANA